VGRDKIWVKAGRNDVVNSIVLTQIISSINEFPFFKDLEDRLLERLTVETHSDLLEASSYDKKPHENTAGAMVRVHTDKGLQNICGMCVEIYFIAFD
jgi:hypothetical protein